MRICYPTVNFHRTLLNHILSSMDAPLPYAALIQIASKSFDPIQKLTFFLRLNLRHTAMFLALLKLTTPNIHLRRFSSMTLSLFHFCTLKRQAFTQFLVYDHTFKNKFMCVCRNLNMYIYIYMYFLIESCNEHKLR